ncbi:hypothetical protein GDO86_001283 [Hymenochirus boettgeri]|uniref:Uncharacterized protein n=1 Tax=Hymenochirus boettgeri TaxID=247094 RepID=A0A8T2KKF6_9PIPI|nr:hypothetical protein GDO86_001283 [Hymenochirus boettgeri]
METKESRMICEYKTHQGPYWSSEKEKKKHTCCKRLFWFPWKHIQSDIQKVFAFLHPNKHRMFKSILL